MITVKTYLGPDSFGGTGLFADQDIKKGDIVWRFVPEYTATYTLDEYARLIAKNDDRAATLKKYAYPGRVTQGDAVIPVLFHDLDNGSYINHSDTPSVGYVETPDHPSRDERFDINIALRDIGRGQEITNDYYAFDDKEMSVTRQLPNCMSFLLGRRKP